MTTGVALVTGAAGFIGSNLCDELLRDGWKVIGVDCYTPYYPEVQKWANLNIARRWKQSFTFINQDVVTLSRADLAGVDIIYHLAGQPGVRPSWGVGFDAYVQHNIIAAQHLFELAVMSDLHRLVLASTSSVYGNATGATREGDVVRPLAPYGATKLAMEHVANAYVQTHGLPVTTLRYFSVYGARQRPDMAFYRMIEAALHNHPFPVYGDGEHRRDFTHVADVVSATMLAGSAPLEPGTILNIGYGDGNVSVLDAADVIAAITGESLQLVHGPEQPGDARATWCDNSAAQRLLGWTPRVALKEGLERQVSWHQMRQTT